MCPEKSQHNSMLLPESHSLSVIAYNMSPEETLCFLDASAPAVIHLDTDRVTGFLNECLHTVILHLVSCSGLTGVFFFCLQAIFNAQKTSVPGDLITVPGATEKISFICTWTIFVQTFLVLFIHMTDF